MNGVETVLVCQENKNVSGGGHFGGDDFDLTGTIIKNELEAVIKFTSAMPGREKKNDIKLKC